MNELLLYKIQGYLESLANLNSSIDGNCGYAFVFYHIVFFENVHISVKEHVIEEYKNTVSKQANDKETIEFVKYLNENLNIIECVNWKERLITICNEWFVKAIVHNLSSKKIQAPLNAYVASSEFVNILIEYFGDNTVKVWEFDDRVKDKLYYFWGGLGYKDFVFECNSSVYILHFDFVD